MESDRVPEEDIDYVEILRRGGANLGDEDFAFFRCPHCRNVSLLDYEHDTVYIDPTDLNRRLSVYGTEFVCVDCDRVIPDHEAWVGDKAGADFGVTWDDLLVSGWRWAIRSHQAGK